MNLRKIKFICKITLTLFSLGFLIAFCVGQYGSFPAALAIGTIIDVPTIITILIARYARKIRWVLLAVPVVALSTEAMVAMMSPTNNFGSMLAMRLAAQAAAALIVRAWLKKSRPSDNLIMAAE